MNRQERDEFWRKRLIAAEQSGLTVKDWCKQNHVERRSYYEWKRRLSPAAVSASADVSATDWLPVSVQEPDTASANGCITIRVAGAVIDVHGGFNPTLLRAVVLALGPEQC